MVGRAEFILFYICSVRVDRGVVRIVRIVRSGKRRKCNYTTPVKRVGGLDVLGR